MGAALQSSKKEKLIFDLTLMPEEWTKFAPLVKKKWESRPSRKRDNGFHVTKNTLVRTKGKSKPNELKP
jgi:hypothetical protein